MRRWIITLSCIAMVWFVVINAWWYLTLTVLEPSDSDGRVVNTQFQGHKYPTGTEEKGTKVKRTAKDYSLCPKPSLLSRFNIFKTKKSASKYFVTIGVPTVLRQSASYLSSTIGTLINNLSEEERKYVVIVVFIADLSEKTKKETAIKLLKRFRDFISSGLLRVIHAPRWFYPTLEFMREHANESHSYAMWRSKQVADFAYLMCYSQDLSKYYLHLEDDVAAAPAFMKRLKDFIKEQRREWAILDSSGVGVMGKLFKSEHLSKLANFFLVFHSDKPADELQYLWERTMVDLRNTKKLRTGAIFQHIGDQSSFEHKTTNFLKQKFHDNHAQKYLGLNPKALVTSNLEAYKGQARDCYVKGTGYFWTKGNFSEPKTIDVVFHHAFSPKRIVVGTGSMYTPNDTLHTGELRVGYYKGWFSSFCSDMETVAFFVDGQVDINLTYLTESIKCLQIVVTKPQREWIFFRSIDIWNLAR